MSSSNSEHIDSSSPLSEPIGKVEHLKMANVSSNEVKTVLLMDVPIVALTIDSQDRLCLAQISNTLLKDFSYNEIHNRRVALGITCVQCTPVQLEILRRAGAMPISSRRCGMITKREAERLCKSFLSEEPPVKLPESYAFEVYHECSWGGRGSFVPARYNSSRAKCIRCHYCQLFFSPNKFIFHFHRVAGSKYVQPDAANFNSWRRHLHLVDSFKTEETLSLWEDVKAMFNGGSRKRILSLSTSSSGSSSHYADTSVHQGQTDVLGNQMEGLGSTNKLTKLSHPETICQTQLTQGSVNLALNHMLNRNDLNKSVYAAQAQAAAIPDFTFPAFPFGFLPMSSAINLLPPQGPYAQPGFMGPGALSAAPIKYPAFTDIVPKNFMPQTGITTNPWQRDQDQDSNESTFPSESSGPQELEAARSELPSKSSTVDIQLFDFEPMPLIMR